MKLKTIFTFLTICLFSTYVANAQKTAFEMSKQMSRAINLGNTLEAENYEGGWAPVAEEEDFEAFKQAGITAVRIPITWGAQLAEDDSTPRVSNEKPYTINEKFIARVDKVIKWSLDRGLVTIINCHHEHWLKKSSTFDQNSDRFYSIWEQLAKHFKDAPQLLMFEILNEPHHSTNGVEDGITQVQLDDLNKKVLGIIRKKNPTRIAIYMGATYSGIHNLLETPIPDTTDKYLMASYHSYSPWNYAGEGNGTWGSDEDKKATEDEFEKMMKYSKEHNVPVFIGEYGANQRCEYNSRMQHYAFYVENIQKNQVAAAAWDDGGYRFKVLDKDSGVWDDAKDIIVNYSHVSPTGLKLTIADGEVIHLNWKNRNDNIEKITIERRVGRIGNFEQFASIDVAETFADTSVKEFQTYYYYRLVNHLKDGSKLISYPQMVYIP